MSSAIFGADCAPSARTKAPASCARRAISASGFSVPRTFETCATATSFGPRSSSDAYAARSSRPSSVIGTQSMIAPVRSASSCQGTMFEWCSISVSTMRSPAPMLASPHA